MFDKAGLGQSPERGAAGVGLVAGEAPGGYEARAGSPGAGLDEALAGLACALDRLAGVDLSVERDRAVLDAALALQRQANRLAGQQLRVLGFCDNRDAHTLDGAVTLASWYRTRTRLDHGEATKVCNAARRLPDLPRLQAALRAGDVTRAHVTTVTTAAIPRRAGAVSQCEQALVELATAGPPQDLRTALARVRDCVDPDGTDAAPLNGCGPDERRTLDAAVTIDGLVEGRFTMDQIDGEAFLTMLDAAEVPDPPDTPGSRRRSPGQRRADALASVVRGVLDNGSLPTSHGVKPHIVVTMDLATLVGNDDNAERTPRLRYTGALDPDRARHIAAGDAAVTVVETMGPWRPVNVGRRFRVLPAWLRVAVEAVHRHCRGPDCDRPLTWSDMHHQDAWDDLGDTDVNKTVPLCKKHHALVTNGHWNVTFDPDTGDCTWTNSVGHTILTRAPPP